MKLLNLRQVNMNWPLRRLSADVFRQRNKLPLQRELISLGLLLQGYFSFSKDFFGNGHGIEDTGEACVGNALQEYFNDLLG